jgi:Mrp family chromosome partitioning ATPase/capsular polysaccharide biosynthesis protein
MHMNGPTDRDDIEIRESLGLADYLRVIRERFWVIAAVVAVVLAATLALSITATPQYRASTRLLYQKNNLEQALFQSQVFTASNNDRDVQTGALLVELSPIADAVKTQLDSQRSADSLLKMVSVVTHTNTNVIDIEAVSSSAQEAADVVNAFADQFVLFRQNTDRATVEAARRLVADELDKLSEAEKESGYGQNLQEKYQNLQIIEAMQNGGYTVVQRAVAPNNPFSPQTTRNAIIAVVLGLVLGVALAFLLDYLDRRIKDEKTLETELGVPVLASVPTIGRRRRTGRGEAGSRDWVGFKSSPALLEAFRTLRSNLQYFSVESRQAIWLITSASPEEGKTSTTVNLGLSLALSGRRVVILEADLRRPMVHEYLNLGQAPGLSNLLAGTKRLGDVLQFVKADEFLPARGRRREGEEQAGILQRNIYAISSGPLPPNPAELLASDRMAKLIKDLAGMTDCLLIDTAPVLAVSDALSVSRHVDGVLVVARIGTVTKDQVREMRDVFERAGTRVIGAVATGIEKGTGAYYRRGRYGHGYGYGYGEEGAIS